MSAPYSMGRTSAGEADVLSITSGSSCVGDGGELLDVDDVQLGIAQRLGIDGLGLRVDGFAQAVEVVGVDKPHGDAQPRKGVVEEVVSAAVERGGGYDFFARRASVVRVRVSAAWPEAVARPAAPPSRAATRFSKTSVVGFMMRV